MNITFKHLPAEDESVDAATQILVDGVVREDLEIQHTGARMRSLNRYFHNAAGQLTAMQSLGDYPREADARMAVQRLIEGAIA